MRSKVTPISRKQFSDKPHFYGNACAARCIEVLLWFAEIYSSFSTSFRKASVFIIMRCYIYMHKDCTLHLLFSILKDVLSRGHFFLVTMVQIFGKRKQNLALQLLKCSFSPSFWPDTLSKLRIFIFYFCQDLKIYFIKCFMFLGILSNSDNVRWNNHCSNNKLLFLTSMLIFFIFPL